MFLIDKEISVVVIKKYFDLAAMSESCGTSTSKACNESKLKGACDSAESKSDENPDLDLTKTEKIFMEKAFFYAKEALSVKEVPVGCIFVFNDEIIALGRNTVNETRNATRHAEINCIEQVNDYCKVKNLDFLSVFAETYVYVTVEPCIMCAAALYELKVKSIVFGCKNDRFGGQTVLNVAELINPTTTIKGGYREQEAMDLLKEFYRGTNPNAPPAKVKVKTGKSLNPF